MTEPAAWVAVVAAVLAVLLVLPSGSARPAEGSGGEPRGRPPRWWSVGGVVAAAVAVLPPSALVLVGLAVAVGVAATVLLRARRRRMLARATSRRVLELCEHLSSDLGAGQPPGAVLVRAAEEWPVVAPVAEAHRIGSDVPGAWRELARLPGADDLRLVAAAWQLTHRTGAGLADAVDRVARGLRAAQATRRTVDGELASARATARLVAALPLVALAMGSGAGGDPWGFLLGHPLGLACLAAGLALGFAGLWWIEAIARDVERSA
ncbi:type II secretion system F family protein [Nocardioides lijunqiniae]|uniref:type II secretion system F family protein n=1 Tax=Nocardioides lijunqiniae TaxID=2760832 RepID=UPI0018787457|nr:type II secretion system F family protein [Nocardioides lijunqiniae]